MLFSILFRSFTLYFLFPFFCSQEVLLILEERLGELEQEKQEFAEYEQLERQRREARREDGEGSSVSSAGEPLL